jgi:Uri superfamily endonuclease
MQNKNVALYQLGLLFREKILIKKPKPMLLDPGFYIYTGRANKAMEARIARHLKREKTLRWHIDQLSTHSHLAEIDYCLFELPPQMECELNQSMEHQQGFLRFIRGFGNSDCRGGCIGHLVHFDENFNWERYCEKNSDN